MTTTISSHMDLSPSGSPTPKPLLQKEDSQGIMGPETSGGGSSVASPIESSTGGRTGGSAISVGVGVNASKQGIMVEGLGFVEYRYIALLALVFQTVGAILTLRLSRTIMSDGYINTTAVCVCEFIKLIGSFFLFFFELNFNFSDFSRLVHSEIVLKPYDTFKVGIPAILYTLQNNLLFIALSNLSPAVYQITYQLKILTTAILAILVLHTRISTDKWISLFVLTLGVVLIQLPAKTQAPSFKAGNPTVGTLAVLLACWTSGFAGIYFEKILKGSKTSIWLRNVQLALLGSALSILGALYQDGARIHREGFFTGYNKMTWIAIGFQSAGGLIVASVLKYADNLMKCFANAIAISLSCILAYLILHDYTPNLFFFIGTALVLAATYTYNMDLPIRANAKTLLRKFKRHGPFAQRMKIQMDEV